MIRNIRIQCRAGKDGSAGLPDMNTTRLFTSILLFAGVSTLHAADYTGVVIDPSRRPIAGAQVAAINSQGIITQQLTGDDGRFNIYLSPLYENVRFRVAAPGFQTTTVPLPAPRIQLAVAPVTESVRVAASAIDVSGAEQGSSVSVITNQEIRGRNEAQIVDLLRQSPGMVVSQSGSRGTVASLFVRGGDSKYNLVMLNGIPINGFYYGGLFDFSHIPSDAVQEIDIARGPQSAVYGSYALSSAINVVTRAPSDGPALDVIAEGGTHELNRFAVSGSGSVARGWGLAGSLSSLNANGPVRNSDYRNQAGLLSMDHRWRTQSVFAFGSFSSNEAGSPGAWGSNPKGYFGGPDLISRSKNNTSTYGVHYQNDVTDRLRADVLGGFYLNNNFYKSPFGGSYNKDIRGFGDARATFTATRHWTMAGGYTFAREEMKNNYVTDSLFNAFLLRRDNHGIYWENHVAVGKFYLNAGLREEIYQQPGIPANAFGFPPRPVFPAHDYSRLNPKLSAAYTLAPGFRVHASFGTGLRPPGGSDLAFTNNPDLSPERTRGFDAGIEQLLMNGRLSLDATWFHTRFEDLIVSLGGSLSTLSRYSTDNVANARSRGAEFTARLRPSSWVLLTGSYTWLDTRVESLDGGNGLVQQYYTLGQPLLRRPKQSGNALATVT
ncbi:MAG: TonB-dependent receptor, partial [Bryobacterales bacterium]|nr:TonB-dependent receptor [Bryobacterales bacterium]